MLEKNFESTAYWALFAGVVVAVSFWEMWRPWRKVSDHLGRRWTNHALLLVAFSAIMMLVYRGSAVATAVSFEHSGWGVFNRGWAPWWVRCALAFFLLDLIKYTLHRVLHAVPALWKVHQVHHSDADLDLSTGLRSHPVERFIGLVVYLGSIALLAPPAWAVLANELVSLVQSFLTHANVSMPVWLERPLRAVWITPEMHRVHHSDEIAEQNANLGDIFPWWDRLFGTYVHAPAAGHDGIVIGLKECREAQTSGLIFMLAQPFRRVKTEQERPRMASSATAGD